MQLHQLVTVSSRVAATSGRLEKIALLAELIAQLDPAEIEIAIGFLIGWPRQGKLGIGWATVRDHRPPPAPVPELELASIDWVFETIKGLKGKGSSGQRSELFAALLSRATAPEQEFLGALALGEVRQGALEGVVSAAVARAARLPEDRVRRAVMLAGDLGRAARVLLTEGESGLSGYRIELFRPVHPMLADSASDLGAALDQLGGRAAIERKLDGARIQVHKSGSAVRVYTRSNNEVTAAVPEVEAALASVPGRELILDGEVIALDRDGRPLPFQVTMRRFGRRLDIDRLRADIPLTPFFFDLLFHDGESLLDHPYHHRVARLTELLPEPLRVPRIVTDELAEAARFEAATVAAGHEGIMAKALDAAYSAGRRGSAWLKVKTARTLDLVVLAAEWGSGRRRGWLSNLHLGARDPNGPGFVMLGKTFKGMTDEILAWQTEALLARETHRDGHVVHVRPELVVEVAFNEVQASSQYPGGLTLRFARLKGYRPDKPPGEADTLDAVRALAAPGTLSE
jgi:DNA ligase-1